MGASESKLEDLAKQIKFPPGAVLSVTEIERLQQAGGPVIDVDEEVFSKINMSEADKKAVAKLKKESIEISLKTLKIIKEYQDNFIPPHYIGNSDVVRRKKYTLNEKFASSLEQVEPVGQQIINIMNKYPDLASVAQNLVSKINQTREDKANVLKSIDLLRSSEFGRRRRRSKNKTRKTKTRKTKSKQVPKRRRSRKN